MAAVMLTVMVSMTGAVVDLGLLYSAKSELQNAADAAALAGAATLIAWDGTRNAVAQPGAAVGTAQRVCRSNQAQGVNLELRAEDVTTGLWVESDQAFDSAYLGALSDPDKLSGCQVVVRRDDLANQPVDTIFAGAVGLSTVNLSATSTAYLGYPGSVEEGMVDLPIALEEDAITGRDGPNCGRRISFHSENDENAQWTSFFTHPANNNSVRDYVDGTRTAPALQVGDELETINGNLSNNTFKDLARRFQEEGSDTDGDGKADSWQVLLPVMSGGSSRCGCNKDSKVVGFAHVTITEVKSAPHKEIEAVLQCGLVVPNSPTGGGNYGSRAAAPKLVR